MIQNHINSAHKQKFLLNQINSPQKQRDWAMIQEELLGFSDMHADYKLQKELTLIYHKKLAAEVKEGVHPDVKVIMQARCQSQANMLCLRNSSKPPSNKATPFRRALRPMPGEMPRMQKTSG